MADVDRKGRMESYHKNVILIPTPPIEGNPESYLPLQPINGKAAIRHTYDEAKSVKRGDVIVIVPDSTRIMAEYCRQGHLFWRPVKTLENGSDLEYAAQLVKQFRTASRGQIESILIWPWNRPLMDRRVLGTIMKDMNRKGVGTIAEDMDGHPIVSCFPIRAFRGESYKMTRVTYKTNLLPVTEENLYGVAKQLATV